MTSLEGQPFPENKNIDAVYVNIKVKLNVTMHLHQTLLDLIFSETSVFIEHNKLTTYGPLRFA